MKIWKYPSSAALLINCCWSALDHGLSLNNISLAMIWMLIYQFILKDVFLCHCQMLNITFRDFDDSSSDSFFAPSWLECCLFFFQGSTVLPPRWSTFQGVLRNVDVIFVKNFANSIDVLVWKSFLCLNQISTFQWSCLFKYNCWNEIREMSVFEIIFFSFEIQTSLVKDPTHTNQCSPLIVLYFENRNNSL